MKFKLFLQAFIIFIVCRPSLSIAAQQVNTPTASQQVVVSEKKKQATVSEAEKKVDVEDETIIEENAAVSPAEEESLTDIELEEPAEEEAPTEEETPEKESPPEEEPELGVEEESEEPQKGFVSKWEDIGFDFDALEVAPLPVELDKTQAEQKLPEVTELDIDFEGLTESELAYVSIPKADKKAGLLLQLPIVGDVVLEPIMINNEYGYQFKSIPGSRTINAGILVIDTYTLTLVGQEVSFIGQGSLLGKKGKLYLKHIAPGGLVPVTSPSIDKAQHVTSTENETKGSIDTMVMAFVYDDTERPKITVHTLGELTLEATNIVFQKDKAVLIVGTAHIFGIQAEVGLALTKMRVNAFINVQGRVREECKDPALKDTPACQDLQFEDIIPQIVQINKSIGKSRIKDLILKISNLIVLNPRKRLSKESMDEDQLQGNLTATLNLAGTDLATDPDIIIKEVSAIRAPSSQKHAKTISEKNPLEARIEMKFDKYSITGDITADMLYLKHVGKIENPTIAISIDRSGGITASIIITGNLIIPLQGLDPLKVSPVNIELTNDGLVVSGLIPEFTYKKLQLNNLELRFDSPAKSLVLGGTKHFGDFDLKIDLMVVKPESLRDKESKGELEFKAKLTTTTLCAQNEYTCIKQGLDSCKQTEPIKRNILKKKEQDLEIKELQAIKLGLEGKETEAELAWKEWDSLAEDIFKEKNSIAQCIPVARETCKKNRDICEQKQTLARKQATSRIEVEQVRAELAKEKGEKKVEEKVEIEDISFYPFKFIAEAPAEIRAIKLTNIDIGLEYKRDAEGSSAGTLYFSGKVHAFGAVVPGNLRLIYEGENKDGVVLTINLERVTLAQLFPFALGGSPYNTIYIENPKVVISNIKSQVKAFGELEKGIHVSGSVPLSGGLDNIGKLLGKEGKTFSLIGTINFNAISKSKIEIAILKDVAGLTVQEKCQKEALDCIKNNETACGSAAQSEKATCNEKGKRACINDQTACEKGINDLIRLNVVSVVIAFEPSFAVKAGLTLRPPVQKNQPIDFYGVINFGVKDASIDAYMQGTWHDVLTLPGWELSDLAIKVGLAYGSPVPTKLGGAGRIKIVGKSLAKVAESWGKGFSSQKENESKPATQGKTNQEAEKIWQAISDAANKTVSSVDLTMEAAILADAGMTDIGLEFKTTKIITWEELLLVFCAGYFESIKNNALVQKLKFIDTLLLKVYDFSGNYAARDISIGAKTIPRGMGFGCTVEMLGKKGRLRMQLRDDGLEGIGIFEKIDTPYFKLTGAGEDKILGTADDAPIMRVALNILNQEFYIDGQVELIIPQLGSLKSLARINIGFDELRFLMQGNVFNLFVADLEARVGYDPKKIYIKGKLQHNSFTQFEKLLKDTAKSLNAQARQAKAEVQKLNQKDVVLANRKALEKAKKDVHQALVDLTQVKTRLDTVIRSCGR